MINLAGVRTADECIQEELYIAGIPMIGEIAAEGEVPYTFMGQLYGWRFRRAWYYYIVNCPHGQGIPYDVAVELHERKYPISNERYDILGKAIRVDGHCGCPHPKECRYPTLVSIEKDVISARKKLPGFTFDSAASFREADLRELDGIRYIRHYHIDTLVGLKAFVDTIKEVTGN